MQKCGKKFIDQLNTVLDLCDPGGVLLARDVLGMTVLDLALRLCDDVMPTSGDASSSPAPAALCAEVARVESLAQVEALGNPRYKWHVSRSMQNFLEVDGYKVFCLVTKRCSFL